MRGRALLATRVRVASPSIALRCGITFSFRSTCSRVTAASSAGIWPPVARVRAVVGAGLTGLTGVAAWATLASARSETAHRAAAR